MDGNRIDKAERLSGIRAALMAAGAAMIVIVTAIEYGDVHYAGAVRGVSWIVLVALWMLVLCHGGGLRLPPSMRALINDELSLQNRGRALAAGFVAAILASLLLYAVQWWVALTAADALRIVSAAGLASALLHYSWLEQRGA